MKRAKVALARKLGVVLHRMWMDATDFRCGATANRLTHHVSILTMNGDSFRLKQSSGRRRGAAAEQNQATELVDPDTGEITPV